MSLLFFFIKKLKCSVIFFRLSLTHIFEITSCMNSSLQMTHQKAMHSFPFVAFLCPSRYAFTMVLTLFCKSIFRVELLKVISKNTMVHFQTNKHSNIVLPRYEKRVEKRKSNIFLFKK